MSMDAISLAKDFSIFDPSILSEEDKANQRRFPTPKEFVDSVSVGGGDINLDELGKSYTKHYKDYVTKSVGLSPALADAKALAIQNMFFTGKDNTQFNDAWGSILNPQQAQAKAQEQAKVTQSDAGHLDNIARGYYQQSAANFVSSAMNDMAQADSATRVRAGQDWLSNQAANDNSQLVMGGGNQAVDLNNQLSGPLPVDPYGRIAQTNESAAVQNIQQAQTQLDKASVLPESKGVKEFSKTEGFFDAAGQLIMNPIDTALPLVEQSLAPMASQLGAAAVGGVVGGIPGAMVAGGASSYEVNRAAKILEEAQKTGRPLIDIVRDAQARGDIQGEASRYATIVGAADALSMGAAGATMPARTLLGRAAMQTGLQAGLGGAGEAGGQIAATGEITSGRDIAAEALLEIPFGAAEVGISALNRPRTQTDRTPPNESANRQGLGTTTVTPQPIQPNANPLSQFAQQAPQSQAAPQANQQALLPSKTQPHPDDIYYVDQAGRTQYGNPNVQRSFGGAGLTEQSVRGKSIGDLIASGEGDYQSFNRGKAGDAAGEKIDFSQMTVAEVMQRQALPEGNPDRIFTVGKYQAIPETFAEAVQKLGIPADTKVTPALQEYIFSEYLLKDKRPDIRDYITGKSDSLKDAQKAGAMEWAAVADPDTGLSFHGSVGNNKASISSDAFGNSLKSVRQAYANAIAQGSSPDEAWSRAVSSAASNTTLPSVRTSTGFQNTATEQPIDSPTLAPDQLSTPQKSSTLVDGQVSANTLVENKLPKAEIYDAQNNKYKAQYEVVDAATLAPTIEKADNQYRDRNRAESQRQIESIATDPNYGRLNTLHSTFTDGAPVLQQDNTIIAGNGRIAGLKKAYESGSAENYKRSLLSDLASKGVDTIPIEQMQSPILVRRLTDEVDTKKVSVLSNVGSGMAMSPSEQAIIDAGYIQSLYDFTPDDTGDITFQSASGLFKRLAKAVPDTERNSILTDENKVGADGVRRVKNALLYMAYGDSPTLRQMTESGTPDHINVTKALVKAAPVLAELRDNIRQGISHDADITPAIIDSFALFSQIKKDPNNTIESWLNQQDAFTQIKPEVKALVQRLEAATRRPNQLADFLVSYANKLKTYGSPRQVGLLGANAAPSQLEVLNRASIDIPLSTNGGSNERSDASRGDQSIAQPNAETRGESRVNETNGGGYAGGNGQVESVGGKYDNQLSLLPNNPRATMVGRSTSSRSQQDGLPIATAIKQARSANLPGIFGTIAKLITDKVYSTGLDKVTTPPDAAHIFDRLLGNRAREALDVIVTGKSGKVLAVQRMTTGTIDASSVYTGDIIRFVMSLDGAEAFWVGHNHPSGNRSFSDSDLRMTQTIASFANKLTIQFNGMFAIGNGEYSFTSDGRDLSHGNLPKLANTKSVTLVEHVLDQRNPITPLTVSSPSDAIKIAETLSNGENSIILLNTRHEPVAVFPFDPTKHKSLANNKEAENVLAAVARSNAAAAIIYTHSLNDAESVGNLTALLDKVQIRTLDHIAGGQAASEVIDFSPRKQEALYNISPRQASLDQVVHQVATDKQISELAEDALLSVFGESPKNQAIADRLLRQFFFDNFVQSETYPNSRSFVTVRMNELRSSGALKLISDQYFNGNTSFKLKDDASRKPISAEKAEAAIRRILGDISFETTIPDEIRSGAGDAADRVKGFFANGKIYIDTSNIGSIAEAEALAIEELVHRGVANLFGPDYDARLMALYEAIGGEAGIRRFISQHKIEMADDYFNQSPQAQMDELLAHIEANQSTLTVRVKRAFQRLIAHLRNAIRKLNTKVLHNVSDSDIILIARNARNAAQDAVNSPMNDPRFGIRPEKESAELNEQERIRNEFNDRPKLDSSERVKRYIASGKQSLNDRYYATKDALFTTDSDFKTEFSNWVKRNFYSDSTLGRTIADARRGIDWTRAATHDQVISDVVLLEAMVKNIYGKSRSDLSTLEQEQFHRVITGQEAFANQSYQEQIQYFRLRIDNASQQLINEKYREMTMRINELNDDGKLALNDIAADLLAGKDNVPVPPALAQIAKLQRQINTIESNKGSYLHRSYQAFTDPRWAKKVRKQPIFNEAVEFIKSDRLENTGVVLTDEQAIGLLNQWLESASNHSSMIEFSSGQGTNEGILKQRKDIHPILRELLGEFKDPVFNYANTITQVADYVAKQQYQMTLRQLLLSMPNIAFIGKEPEGMKVARFPENAAYSALNDLYIDADFMRDLKEFGVLDDMNNPLMQWTIQLSAAVKLGKTVLSPTTAMRNFWSGFMLLAAAGHSPFGGMKDALSVIQNAKNRMGFLSGDLILNTQEAEQMNQRYVRLGIRRDGASSGELAGIFRDFHKADQAVKEQGLARKAFNSALAFYQFGDDFFKVIHFEKGYADLLETGMQPIEAEQEAARRTRDTMPTYSMVPKALQQLRRFPLIGTFVSFPWEVMRTLKNSLDLIIHDRKMAAETGNSKWNSMANKRLLGLTIAYGLPIIVALWSRALAGIDDDDNEALDHFSSDWRKGQLRLFMGSDADNVSYLDMTPLIPSEYIMRSLRIGVQRGSDEGIWSGLFNTGKELGKPFYSFDISAKGIYNLFTNRDDNGRPIYGEGKTMADLLSQPTENSQHLGEALGYMSKQFGPGIIQNINDFNRALSGSVADVNNGDSMLADFINERAASIGGKVSRSGKEFNLNDAIAALIGFRMTDQNMIVLGQQAANQTRDKAASYSAEFKRAVDVTTPLSNEFLDRRLQQVINDRNRAFSKMVDLAQYYRRKGMTDQEIMVNLYGKEGKTHPMSKATIASIIKGETPPFEVSKEVMSNSLRSIEMIEDPRNRLQAKRAIAERYRYLEQRATELQQQPVTAP